MGSRRLGRDYNHGSAANPTYNLEVKLSDAKDAALLKFAQQHPGQDIQILLSGRVLTNLRMPARGSSPASAIAIGAAFDSPNEAQTIAASLNQLVQ